MESNFCFVCSLGGMLLGFILTNIFWLLRTKRGVLRIDHSNPKKDLYLFEIDNLDDISKKKQVILKVDHNAHLSQE